MFSTLPLKRFITALSVLHLVQLLPTDIEGAKTREKTSIKNNREREKKKAQNIYNIFIKKSIISGFATKGHGLEFHSLSCTTVLTDKSTLSLYINCIYLFLCFCTFMFTEGGTQECTSKNPTVSPDVAGEFTETKK